MIIHFETSVLKRTLCSQTFHLSKSISRTRITILEGCFYISMNWVFVQLKLVPRSLQIFSQKRKFFFWFIYRSDRNIFLAELRNLSRSQFQTPLLYKLFFQLARCACLCNVWIVATCDFLYNCIHQMDKYLKPSFTYS